MQKKVLSFIILTNLRFFSDPRDHVLGGIVDEVEGIKKLLVMILGVLINSGLFIFSMYTPSSFQCTKHVF